MGNLVNKIQLPTKCSMCGNKMFRAQYTEFADKHIHSLDYCPECNKEMEYRLLHEIDSERKANIRNRNLMTIFWVLSIIFVLLLTLKLLKVPLALPLTP
jgi:hypothetical protein